MQWLKNVIIDILVTALIAIAVFTEVEWVRWIILVYTPVMLVLKLIPLFGGSMVRKFKHSEKDAPVWFLHVLYAANVLLLLFHGWWMIGAQWGLIWGLSAMAAIKR